MCDHHDASISSSLPILGYDPGGGWCVGTADLLIDENRAFSRQLRETGNAVPLARLTRARELTSWKAHVRLCKRYRRLMARGKHASQVVVAVARELVGFL